MSSNCKVVMYHYVRPIQESPYPNMKGLELEGFKRQIEYFKKNFRFISAQDLIHSIYDKKEIDPNSILLTFDDGLKDHYSYVFPILKKFGVQGLFFPIFKTFQKNSILDVHKLHFVLASCNDVKSLIDEIFNFVNNFKDEYDLESPEKYYSELASPYSYGSKVDSKEIIFIKRILQWVLPKELSNKIINNFFKKYVTQKENSFSKEFYLSRDEISEMKNEGMFFGNHTFSHNPLNKLTPEVLNDELKISSKFYSEINPENDNWIISYPWGTYNDQVIEKVKSFGYKVGFTTEVGDAILNKSNCFNLKRYDTNHFPQ